MHTPAHRRLDDTAPDLPLPQSPHFAAACRLLGAEVARHEAAFAPGGSGVWQVQARRLPLLGRVEMISRGPVLPPGVALADWLARWQAERSGHALLLNAPPTPPGVLRAAGFWPLMTAATVALLPLARPPEMRAALHQKWRNRLARAERQGLSLHRVAPRADHWMFRAEAEQRRDRGYRALPAALALAFARANPGHVWLYEAREWTAPVAAMLFLRHGRMASYQIGVTLPRGRETGAHNLILWRAMCDLAQAGHGLLDLGSVNTRDTPGLARFKLGTGARAECLGGTWLWHRWTAPLARRLPLWMAR